MRMTRQLLAVVSLALLFSGCGVNKSIHIADGETVNGGKATVNGNVTIGADCDVRCDCRTVNGRVSVGAQSKVGDFVTCLADGTRIVIEAKNTVRIGLVGTTGILEELDQAMVNRDAAWAICVSRQDAYPAEVGSFAVYGNRVLVVDTGDGPLTGVALRWIAAAAMASAADGNEADTAAALEQLGRIRDLAQHFSRSKKVLTTAQSGLESVRQDLDSLRSQLLDLTDEVARALRPAPTSAGAGDLDRGRTFAA